MNFLPSRTREIFGFIDSNSDAELRAGWPYLPWWGCGAGKILAHQPLRRLRHGVADGFRETLGDLFRQWPRLAGQHTYFDPATFLQLAQQVGGGQLVQREIVELDEGDLGRIDLEYLPLSAPGIDCVQN